MPSCTPWTWSGWDVILGIPGTLLILFSFLYSMRKRKLIQVGRPKTLLRLHEVLTWAGALMILVHAGCMSIRSCRGWPLSPCW